MRRRRRQAAAVEENAFDRLRELDRIRENERPPVDTADRCQYSNWHRMIAGDPDLYIGEFEDQNGVSWDQFVEGLGQWKNDFENFNVWYEQELGTIFEVMRGEK